MPIQFREPQKRRRSLPMIPHLAAYKQDGEEMDALRLGLDQLSLRLLQRLSIDDVVQEATWFSIFAHRLLSEPDLGEKIHSYGMKAYRLLPETMKGYFFRNFTIPHTLKEAIEKAAIEHTDHRVDDKRGVTGPWLRIALAYCGFVENKYPVEELTGPITLITGSM